MDEIDISDLQVDLTEEEKEAVLSILNQYAETGSSQILDDLYYEDYDEIPVDIETFITDRRYLGEAFLDQEGNLLIYKFWVNVLKYIFAPNSGIYETVFSGAIGLGKSTIACIGMAYILHRLLCLKDPASYYKLTKGSKVAIALFNINLDQGYGVGYAKLQAMLKQSKWFIDHGTLAGVKSITYYPSKGIEILVGSKMEHFIGRDVFCLSGDTEIMTENGTYKLKDLEGDSVRVFTQKDDLNIELSRDKVQIIKTKEVDELFEIELEDGSIIKCTNDHLLRLSDGRYVRAEDLSEGDDIMEVLN